MSDLTCDSKTQTSLRIARERLGGGGGGGGESIGEGTSREKDKNISIVVSE